MPALKGQQQQSLTEFFAAKKSTRQVGKHALEKYEKLQADLEALKARRNSRVDKNASKEKSPAYERYAALLAPKADAVPTELAPAEKGIESSSPAPTVSKSATNEKSLSRLEAKRAALKAARKKLRQVEEDQAALNDIQKSKKTRETLDDVPAYEKYHYLSVPSESLPLPVHYDRLLESFRACDTVVSMFHNRSEICRFDKLRTAVRKMTNRNFDLSDIAKMLHLKPDAYEVTVENHRFLDVKERMHHIVVFKNPPLGQNPKYVLQRLNDFKEKLLLRVAQYHEEFVEKHMPGSCIPVEAIKRWHPKFKVDSVPDIPEKELPKIQEVSETANAREVLEEFRGKFSDRIEKALKNLAEKQDKEKEAEKAKKITLPTSASESKSTTGISQSLLDRIKRKEALKMAEKIVMRGEDTKEQRVLTALPPLIRTIRQVFLASQKAAILYTELTNKITESGSYDNLDSLMERISEIAPEWYKPLIVRNAKYIKIDKARDVNIICNRVETMLNSIGSSKSI